MKDLVGQTLGHYRIEASLGSGGMGQIFRGKHVYLERPAAIKVMHEYLASNPTFRARFLQEAKSTAALRNPHIVEIYEFGEQDGLLYLVMELMTEGTLGTLLGQSVNRQVEPAEQALGLIVGLDLVRQAAEGLAVAHEQGVIHRDIKPDNLLLKRLSGGNQGDAQYQLKISDFGLARLAESSGLTMGGPVGTPAYMSPEQCLDKKLDGRSDLYSLGIVLYEVVTGSLPFQVNTLSGAVQKHVNTPPRPPQEMRPDLPPLLVQIILRCLTKTPEERYQTGKELAEALQEAINDANLQTMAPLVAPPPLSPPAREQPRPMQQVYADLPTRALPHRQAQGMAPTSKLNGEGQQGRHKARPLRQNRVLWLLPAIAVIVAVALILVMVIPRGTDQSSVLPTPTSPHIIAPTPTPTPINAATLSPAALYKAVVSRPPFYSSDLSQPDKDYWVQEGACSFADGGYVLAWQNLGSLTGCPEPASFSNFAFQVQMTIRTGAGGDGGGLIFRSPTGLDGYRLRIGVDGSYDLTNTDLNGFRSAIKTGLNQTNLLTVIAQGPLIFLYANTQLIGHTSNTTLNQGKLGFMAVAFSQPVNIKFTNVQIWQL